ncbi:hypothetical protein ACPOL_4287 [Acidisarcina polymorpha]|uniref:Uncharacterized protein n=1 Tax=Acidisarcina polymorpha TaxID=2211140 RepID=A0A2Z5G366_9BACT|nr:hypothetical protein ACPOL_4287 [Acidisarcina polymorpha]
MYGINVSLHHAPHFTRGLPATHIEGGNNFADLVQRWPQGLSR